MRKVLFFLSLSLIACDSKPDRTIVVDLPPKADPQKTGKTRDLTYREQRNQRCEVVENCFFGYETDAYRILYRDDPKDWKDTKIFTEKKLEALKKLPLTSWFIGSTIYGEAFCTKEVDGVICLPMRLLGEIKRGSICKVELTRGDRKLTDYSLYYGSYHCPYLTVSQYGGVEFIFTKLHFAYVKSINRNFRKYVMSKDLKKSDFDYLK